MSSRNVENDDGDLIHEEEEEEVGHRDVHVLQPVGEKNKKKRSKRNDKKNKSPES